MATSSGQKSLQLIEKRTLAEPDRRYWGSAPSANASELKYMYSIGLIDLKTFKQIKIDRADPANSYNGRGAAWFTFPIPPKSYNISEPAATVITPTQDGGKFIENQGSIIKDIQIAGTVGLRPNPVSNELIPGLAAKTGVKLTAPKVITDLATNVGSTDDRGLLPAEITGLDDITFLRNIFRGYWDLKKQDNWARRVAMVWLYAKEGEWYIVEPISFQTSRDSGNPMSWTYAIQLRTIYRFDEVIPFAQDRMSTWQQIENVWKTVGQAINDLTISINQIVNAINFAVQLPFNLMGDFLNLATGLLGSLANLRNVGKTAKSIVRQGMLNLEHKAEELANLAQQIAYGEAAGDKRVFGSVKEGHGEVPPSDDAAELILRSELRRAFVKIARLAKRLHALDALYQESRQVQVTDYANRYLESGRTQYSGGSAFDPNNINMPSSADEVAVDGTIRGMAKQHLGSEEYWKLLAMLNNLKYPYIAAARSSGVLQYGDKILIPKVSDSSDMENSTQDTLTDAGKEALSPVVKKYGRDLVLNQLGSSAGATLSDVGISQRGDLDIIEGVPNVEQAMMIKFGTEEGGLSTHPTFGAAFPLGTKLGLGRLQEFAINTRRTLLSDDRVKDIARLKLYADGDVIRVGAYVVLKQSDIKLPVSFSVRRG